MVGGRDPASARWFQEYVALHAVHVSVVTVVERIRRYALLWQRARPDRKIDVERARIDYLKQLGTVMPLDIQTAVVAAKSWL